MRKKIYPFLASLGATVALFAGVALIISAGLPQRTTFTSTVFNGQVVAPEISALAPPINKVTLAGDPITLHNLRGTPVILNFWATWCIPCRLEMPILQTVYNTYQEDGLHIIAINMGESPAIVSDWINNFGFTYDIVIDRDDTLFNDYLVRGQPSTFIVSPTGIITNIFYGPVSEGQLNDAISDFFGE